MNCFHKTSAAFAIAGAMLFAACSETTEPEEENQDFTGTYTLVSFSQGSAAGVNVIPGATGDFTMTDTTYEVTTTIPTQSGPNVVTDEGTYEAVGTETSGTFEQQSTINPGLQYSGTYEWDPATEQLTLDTTSQGIRNVLVIQKT